MYNQSVTIHDLTYLFVEDGGVVDIVYWVVGMWRGLMHRDLCLLLRNLNEISLAFFLRKLKRQMNKTIGIDGWAFVMCTRGSPSDIICSIPQD